MADIIGVSIGREKSSVGSSCGELVESLGRMKSVPKYIFSPIFAWI
jgi:hypothetical protein